MLQDQEIIYLDNNATTQVDPAVVAEMMPFLTSLYGNASSAYTFGSQIRSALDLARERVAALIDCEPREIIFTSCGTESDNAAILSALQMDRDRQHIVTTRVEHSAITKQCENLARQGYEITWLKVDSAGRLDLDEVKKAVRSDTAIVSAMWANNETGVLFPVEKIAEMAHAKGALFHTDAVQAVGKIPISLRDTRIHYLALSGHKLHCPKGVGALYVNRKCKFNPFMIGGGQENGKRGGTENVASIVALGKACELAQQYLGEEQTVVRRYRDRFEEAILSQVANVTINGDREHRLPNTSSLHIEGLESEGALILLDQAGICASAGSACTTGSLSPSHVLTAMGMSTTQARASLRFSFGRFNNEDQVTTSIERVVKAVAKLRESMQPGPVAFAA